MAIATATHSDHRSASRAIPYRFSIEMAGFMMMLIAAWGGIVSFIGPLLGYHLDSSAAWTWNLTHTFLFLLPGGAAFLAALVVMIEGGAGREHRSALMTFAATIAVLAGAWFVIGPIAWPVIDGVNAFGSASAFHTMTYWIGSALGPGALIVALGAFVLGRPHPNRTSEMEYGRSASQDPSVVEVRTLQDPTLYE